jgi:hypothetical protein
MKDDQKAHKYLRKAREYRVRARAAVDPRVRSALEAVAREFIRKARDSDTTDPRQATLHPATFR